VYSFHPFTDAELAEVAKACEKEGYENGGNQDFVAVAPKPHFLDEEAEVEKIIAYHRKLKNKQSGYWDPNHFIVVKNSGWKKEGVLVVTLREFELAWVPDDGVAYKRGWDAWTFRVENSGLVILNLQIVNMGWTEFTTWKDCQPEGQEVDRRDGTSWEDIQEEETGQNTK